MLSSTFFQGRFDFSFIFFLLFTFYSMLPKLNSSIDIDISRIDETKPNAVTPVIWNNSESP